MNLLAAALLGMGLLFLVRSVQAARGASHAHELARLRGAVSPESTEEVPQLIRRRVPTQAGLAARLARAGLRWTITDYLIVTALLAAIGWLILKLATGSTLVALLGIAIGVLLPHLFVRHRITVRRQLMNAQLADAVDLVASSLRSGFGFVQCLELGSREQPPPLADELREVVRNIELGMSIDTALEGLAERNADSDLNLIVQAILVQRRAGGDLASVLSRIVVTIRDRVRIQGEIRALTSQARLSGRIVGLLPVALALLIGLLQPAQMETLLFTPSGRMLLGAAAVLECIGFFAVSRFAVVEY